jgi:alpha-N-acetylglucosamine transferase
MKKRILLRVGVFLLSLLVVVSIVTIYKKLNGTSIEHYAQYMFPCKGQIITMKGIEASIEFRILDEKEMEGYLINGRGSDNRVTEDNLLIYKVTLDEQYKDDDIAIVPGGTYIYNYFLIRTDKDSPWLIDDYGLEM